LKDIKKKSVDRVVSLKYETKQPSFFLGFATC